LTVAGDAGTAAVVDAAFVRSRPPSPQATGRRAQSTTADDTPTGATRILIEISSRLGLAPIVGRPTGGVKRYVLTDGIVKQFPARFAS
jgi:hypothetical protein